MLRRRLILAFLLSVLACTGSAMAQDKPVGFGQAEPDPPTEDDAPPSPADLVAACIDGPTTTVAEIDATMKVCEAAAAASPEDAALKTRVSTLKELRVEVATREKVEALLADCASKQQAGDLKGALSACEQAAAIDPDNAAAEARLAEVKAAKRRADDASGATNLIPGKGNKTTPPNLKRDSKEAQEAREAAMGKMAEENPAQGGAGKFKPIDKPEVTPPVPSATSEPLVRLEHHGYFRFRADLFSNLDLDTKGTSPIPPPLEARESQPNIAPTDDEILAGANMRFRYAPTLHITEDLRINAIVDILDNIVLGSTPDGLRAGRLDIPLLAFTGGQEEPRTDTIGKDSLIVRAAFAEWATPFGLLRAGRMPSHWGLGILANGGGDAGIGHNIRKKLGEPAWTDIDANHGDYVDRVMFLTMEPFTRAFWITLGWDFVSEGLVGYNAQNDSYTQALDLGQADDVIQIVAAVFSRPILPDQVETRAADIGTAPYKPVFDWGAYFVYREQEADVGKLNKSRFQGNGSSADLQVRGATAYIPDIWLRFIYPFGAKNILRLELEATGIFGSIDQVTETDDRGRDIFQLGLAFEGEYQWNDLFVGLNAGFASGKDTYGFGYLDILAVSDQTNDINNFRFDRNYFIDLIMFRELVGGITNAVYFDPWAQYQFPLDQSAKPTNLGGRLDLVTAVAPQPETTPGNGTWYGFEADVRLFFEEPDIFRAELAGGFFFPGDVWDRIPDHPDLGGPTPQHPIGSAHPSLTPGEAISASFAWTLQANIWWMF